MGWEQVVEKARELVRRARTAPRTPASVQIEHVIERGIVSHSEAVVRSGLERLQHEAEVGERVTRARQAGLRVRKSLNPADTLERDAEIAERVGHTERAADLRERARIIRAREPGLARSEVSQVPFTPDPIEADLARRAQAGDKAATDQLVLKVEKLVWKMAHDMKRPGVEAEDLVQEGIIGALEAVKGFDPAKGKWSTWAAVWIKGAMKASRGSSRVVKLATGKRTLVRRFWATIDDLRATHGFNPEMGEVRERMGLSTEAFDNLLAAATGPVSMPMGGYEAAKMAPARVEVGEALASAEAKSEEAIRAGLNTVLTPREAEVFWMSAFEEKSTTQIAMRFNARHAAIKMNLLKAGEKLRAALGSKTLGESWPALMIVALFAGGLVEPAPTSVDDAAWYRGNFTGK